MCLWLQLLVWCKHKLCRINWILFPNYGFVWSLSSVSRYVSLQWNVLLVAESVLQGRIFGLQSGAYSAMATLPLKMTVIWIEITWNQCPNMVSISKEFHILMVKTVLLLQSCVKIWSPSKGMFYQCPHYVFPTHVS